MQHFGQLKDENASITEAEAIMKVRDFVSCSKNEYEVAEVWLKINLKG